MRTDNPFSTALGSINCLSNTPFPLDAPDTAWGVKYGTMAVFAIATLNGVPQGARRYLFDLSPGDVLFGMATIWEGQSHILMAIAYEETQLVPIALADWLARSSAIASLQQWSDRLAGVLRSAGIAVNAIEAAGLEAGESLSDRLEQFHSDFLLGLHELASQEQQLQAEQLRSRQQLNEAASERALSHLTAVFRRKQENFSQEGTALLVAAGAVGRAMGIEIHPPTKSEDQKRLKDPLSAIARASKIRTRRIILRGNWWQFDCGPILAYTLEGEAPVAILPQGRNRYEIFDPETQRRIPLTADTAKLISPLAFVFYRPFPDRVLKALDIIKFATRGTLRDGVIILGLGAFVSVLGMLTPLVTGILIDNAIPRGDRGLIFQVALGLLAVSFGSTLLDLVQNVATIRWQTLAEIQTQAATWDRLLKLRANFFRKFILGDLQLRVSGIAQLNQILSSTVMATVLNSLFALLNLGLLFFYSFQLAIVAIAIAAVNLAITLFSFFISRKKMIPLQELSGEIFGLTVQLIAGVSKLRVADAEERAFAHWAKKFGSQLELMLSTEAIEDAVMLFNTILPTVSSILVYGLGVTLIAQAQARGQTGFSTGTFLAFNAAFGTFVGGVNGLSGAFVSIMGVAIIWERVKPILEEKPEVDDRKTDPGRLAGAVKLERVSFRYLKDAPLTLNKVSIEAKPGEFIALVGPSGSGKSTIVRLLLGFEQPEEGKIYYDSQDLAELDILAVRRQLGVMLQDGRINTSTIFENISGGALVTMEEAWEAAKMAGFADEIEQMPMGMHTVISEGGTNISGGQRQRLLIARSLVLKPKILIFDEATSALDNRTQATVSESLDSLQVTRIVVAHRLSTIRHADRIYVIVAGEVVQVGNFEELMAQPGMFADLMARQIM